jgi:hypothetical protein
VPSFIFENDVNVPSKSNKQKDLVMTTWFAAVEEAGGGSYSDGGEAANSPGRSPSKRAKVRLF